MEHNMEEVLSDESEKEFKSDEPYVEEIHESSEEEMELIAEEN